MTRERQAIHRPGCEGPMKPPSRVGPWVITRCACGAVEIRKAEATEDTDTWQRFWRQQ